MVQHPEHSLARAGAAAQIYRIRSVPRCSGVWTRIWYSRGFGGRQTVCACQLRRHLLEG